MNFEPHKKSKTEHPEAKSRPGGTALLPALKLRQALDILTTVIFYLAILFFIIGFNFSHNPAGNWEQQFMPNIGGRTISDITFIDTLTGYCITSRLNDTSFVLKTTDSGDSWSYNYTATGFIFSRIQFLNQNTGFAGGTDLIKTTNGGINWFPVNTSLFFEDMTFINNDTGWFVKSNSLTGGVFFTSNGGGSWQQQINLGNQNPNHIYMYNGRIGFICEDNTYLRRTTNSGQTWDVISGADGFTDMYFVDSLTGWKCFGDMERTSNGGLSWIAQTVPFGGNIVITGISRFSNLNSDTIWGIGGSYNIGGSPPTRGILYRTMDSGNNWLFQIPDTAIHINRYFHIDFINKSNGWAYHTTSSSGGIHTTNGGDTTFLVPLQQISNEVPKEYRLFNNYPNPFNAMTKFKFQISKEALVKIKVFAITGKEAGIIVNDRLSAGEYEIIFNANNLSSGVYFYSLIIDGKLIDTKRMILIK